MEPKWWGQWTAIKLFPVSSLIVTLLKISQLFIKLFPQLTSFLLVESVEPNNDVSLEGWTDCDVSISFTIQL